MLVSIGLVVGVSAIVSCDGATPGEGSPAVTVAPDRDGSATTTTTAVPTTGVRPPPTAPAAPRRPEGFDTVEVTVTSPRGEVRELCLWSADDDERRRRGLMFVDDLGAADGMAFVYDVSRTTAFTMRNTVLPLTIVFYGPDGRWSDGFDMDPCAGEPCQGYPTPEGFTVAVEVEQGRDEELGLVPGSMLEIVSSDGPDGCR